MDLINEKNVLSCKFVRIPARSPALSICGPLVVCRRDPTALAIKFASVVFPRPGGPQSKA
jgi:hypothetical protein